MLLLLLWLFMLLLLLTLELLLCVDKTGADKIVGCKVMRAFWRA